MNRIITLFFLLNIIASSYGQVDNLFPGSANIFSSVAQSFDLGTRIELNAYAARNSKSSIVAQRMEGLQLAAILTKSENNRLYIGIGHMQDVMGRAELGTTRTYALLSDELRVGDKSFLSVGTAVYLNRSTLDIASLTWGDSYGNDGSTIANQDVAVMDLNSFLDFSAGFRYKTIMEKPRKNLRNEQYLSIGLSANHLGRKTQTVPEQNITEGIEYKLLFDARARIGTQLIVRPIVNAFFQDLVLRTYFGSYVDLMLSKQDTQQAGGKTQLISLGLFTESLRGYTIGTAYRFNKHALGIQYNIYPFGQHEQGFIASGLSVHLKTGF